MQTAAEGSVHFKISTKAKTAAKTDPMKKAKPKEATPATDEAGEEYQPTPEELVVIKAYLAKLKETRAPQLKVSNDVITPSHPDLEVGQALLSHALGTSYASFFEGLLLQLANVSRNDGKVDETKLNFMVAIVLSLKPQDEVEAMLGAPNGRRSHGFDDLREKAR